MVIKLLNHRTIERVGLPFHGPPTIILRLFDSQFPAILFKKLLGTGVDGCVHQPGWIIQEEGLVMILSQESQSIFTCLMKGIAVFIQSEWIFFHCGGKSFHSTGHTGSCSPTASGPVKSLVFRLRESFMINCHVSFPGMPRYIAV